MPADSDQPKPRDFFEEAQRILRKESLLIPERAHLEAVDAQARAMATNMAAIGEVLLCILKENEKTWMRIPAEMVAVIRTSGLMPQIVREPDGAILVQQIAISAPHAAPPARLQ